MYILLVGSLSTGYTCIGPFGCYSDAYDYGNKNANPGFWFAMKIERPIFAP